MNNAETIASIITETDAKVAYHSAEIERLEGDGYYQEAGRHYEQRDDLISAAYGDISYFAKLDDDPLKVWVATITTEDATNDEPGTYIHRTWEGLRDTLIREYYWTGTSEVGNPDTDLPSHFSKHRMNLNIDQQEIGA